jgi:hypothetical protein
VVPRTLSARATARARAARSLAVGSDTVVSGREGRGAGRAR